MANPPKELLQPSWEPLDLSRIEPKPKQIIIDDLFVVQVLLNDRQERDYITIRGLIRTGGDLGLYYRGSITSDRLLKLLKVLHLHLGGPGSDAILYLIQYPEHVLFVRIDSHIHLKDIPPGNRLNMLGVKSFQAGLQAERVERAKKLAEAKERMISWLSKPKP